MQEDRWLIRCCRDNRIRETSRLKQVLRGLEKQSKSQSVLSSQLRNGLLHYTNSFPSDYRSVSPTEHEFILKPLRVLRSVLLHFNYAESVKANKDFDLSIRHMRPGQLCWLFDIWKTAYASEDAGYEL